MSAKSKQGLNYIIQAINNIVEPKVSSLRYDKTYRAKVTQEIDAGIYVVQINGVEYQLPYSGTLNVGDIVKVKAPLNNFSDIYIEALPGSGGGEGGTTNYNDLTNKPILNTDNASSLSANKEEIIRGAISLHKISKTGSYNDLNNLPSLDFIPNSQKGANNGVATLGANGRVPTTQLPSDVVYDNNYVHTDNNFTTPLLNKLNGIEAEAQVNKIESIKRNGTDLEIQDKSVNILVPLKTSELENNGDGTNPFVTTGKIASTTDLGLIKIGANLSITSDGTLNAIGGGGGGGTVSDTLPIGSVVEWYSETIPDNWLICDGKEISRTEYAELFAVLDTTYGAGDGSTTFNIPNMSSRFAVGLNKDDTDFNALGKIGGSKNEDITHNHTVPGHTHTTANHTLTISEMPNHGHGLAISGGSTAGQIDRVVLDGYDQGRWYSTVEPVGGSQPHNHGNTGATPLTTNNNTNTNISTLPPYITVYYIIKAKQSQAVVATVVDNLNSTSPIDALSANQGRILKGYIEVNSNMIDTLQDDIIKIEDKINNGLVTNILDKAYPVGAIYMSTANVSPESFLGGTWERYGKGRTLMGVDEENDNFNTVNKTGGEESHVLTISEMPAHAHNLATSSEDGTHIDGYYKVGSYNKNNDNLTTSIVGGSQAHNNLSPYITVYMWERTA